MTPPPAVDRVWHLHLLYTRSYWDGLCRGILGRPLHHGPMAGGQAEDEKFENWYEKTRALYRAEFGAVPPADLWPIRFSAEARHRWTDTGRDWNVRKPYFSALLPGVFPLLLVEPGAVAVLIAIVCGVFALIVKLYEDESPKKKRREEGGDCIAFSCSSGESDCRDLGGDCGGGDGGGCGGD